MPIKHAFTASTTTESSANDVFERFWNADHVASISGSSADLQEVVHRGSTIVSSNSSAVIDVLNYNLPARTLGTNRGLRITVLASERIGSTAVPNNYNLEILHGGSSRWADTNSTIAAVQQFHHCNGQFWVCAAGTSASRYLSGKWTQSSNTQATPGVGDITAAGFGPTRHFGAIASSGVYSISTGVDENFTFRFNFLGANSSNEFRVYYSAIELV